LKIPFQIYIYIYNPKDFSFSFTKVCSLKKNTLEEIKFVCQSHQGTMIISIKDYIYIYNLAITSIRKVWIFTQAITLLTSQPWARFEQKFDYGEIPFKIQCW
jgi:hypothetical protein